MRSKMFNATTDSPHFLPSQVSYMLLPLWLFFRNACTHMNIIQFCYFSRKKKKATIYKPPNMPVKTLNFSSQNQMFKKTKQKTKTWLAYINPKTLELIPHTMELIWKHSNNTRNLQRARFKRKQKSSYIFLYTYTHPVSSPRSLSPRFFSFM